MRLSTIWTLHGMSMAERLRRSWDWSFREAAVIVPKRLRYHVALQEIVRATHKLPSDTEIPAIPLQDILMNLDTPKGV